MKKALIFFALALMCAFQTVTASAADEIQVMLNGEKMDFDVPPMIINSRTMVPMRAIFEALGYAVAWNGETQSVTAVNPDKDAVLTMVLGDDEMTYNGNSIALDTPPMLINDRTLVPLRAVSEVSGCEVKWGGGARTVTIIDPAASSASAEPKPTAVPTEAPTAAPTAVPGTAVYDKTSVPTYNGAKANPIAKRDGRQMFYYTNDSASDGRRAYKNYIQKLRDLGYSDDERIAMRNELGAALRSKDGAYTAVIATEYRSMAEFEAATTFRAYVVVIDNSVDDKDEYTAKMADEKHYDNTCIPRVEEVTNTILNKRLFVKSKINQYWPAYKYVIQLGNRDKYAKELTDNGYTRCGGAHVLYNTSYPCYVSHSLSEIAAIYSASGYFYVVPESLFSENR